MGRIIVYTLPHCQICKVICNSLRQLGIPFEERNALDYAPFLKANGFSSVPIVQFDGELHYVSSMTALMFLLRERGLLARDET
ncbi:MAG: glutaredoxin domain-containing protein [Archaeoglobaceae archaeon]